MATKNKGVEADAELVAKLQALLNDYLKAAEEQNSHDLKHEAIRLKNYEANVKRLKRILANLAERKAALEDEARDLKKCIEV
jgi:hypothetical protein